MSSSTGRARIHGAAGSKIAQAQRMRPATEFQIREDISKLREGLGRSRPDEPNLWAFFSHKNDRLLTIRGDLAFVQCVLLEGDRTVTAYRVRNPRTNTDAVSSDTSSSMIEVHRLGGRTEVIRCRHARSPTDTSMDPAACLTPGDEPGSSAKIVDISERDLAGRMIEFANWLLLCGAITRCRDFRVDHEAAVLAAAMASGRQLTFRDAMHLPGVDPALMLAAIGKGLASGVLECDLTDNLLTLDMPLRAADGCGEAQRHATCFGPRAGHRAASAFAMPRNRRTNPHPELFVHPERWLGVKFPEVSANATQRCRAKAVQLYLNDRPYSEIMHETGISATWVRKLFYRTLKPGPDEIPMGVRALGRYRHLNPYVRDKAFPASNQAAGGHGGYAGAFGALLSRYPEDLVGLIEQEVLKVRAKLESHGAAIHQARVSWIDLHGQMKAFLRAKGLGEDDCPFNVRNVAYTSLTRLCNALLYHKPIHWILSRGGSDAKRRSRLGQGMHSLISAQWVNQIVELDQHKEDSAAIVTIATPKGTGVGVPTERWWVGGIVERYSHALIATSDNFYPQETDESVLDLLDIAAFPPDPLDRLRKFDSCRDGNWMPGQLMPEFRYQAWDILKLDRAWAHKSKTVLAAVVATVGCAVCFGAPGAWYMRDLIERAFGKVTQSGPQKLPSTYGTGPKDSKRRNPEAQAIRLKISQDDVCDLIKCGVRWVNETGDEGVFWGSPFQTLRTAISGSVGRFFPRPYPQARHEDRPLMWLTLPCKIEGNAAKGLAPCVRVRRTRFRGPHLAHAWSLIRRPALLQVYRRDFRRGRVILEGNGELVDDVRPEEKWMAMPLSWHDHRLIQQFGYTHKLLERSPAPAAEFLAIIQTEVAKRTGRNGEGRLTKRDAGTVARIQRNAQAQTSPLTPSNGPLAETPLPSFGQEAEALLGKAPGVVAFSWARRKD